MLLTNGHNLKIVSLIDIENMCRKELNMIGKIAISSELNTLDGNVDPRFGRAAGFIIFDLEFNEFKYLNNGSSQIRKQGAGIKTASRLVSENIEAILTGYVGPKAYRVLELAGVKIIQDLFGMSVRETIDLYRKGKLFPSTVPKGGSGKSRKR